MKEKVMVKTLITIMLSAVLVVLALMTVNQVRIIYLDKPTHQEEDNHHKRIKIGFSLGTLKEERWIKDRDIVMAKVKEMGADIIVLNANNDDQDQLKQVKALLNQSIDVLIIVPNDLHKAAEAVELAKKQGVKVISYDRLVLNSNVDLYISFDNERVGELMAEAIAERLSKGNLLIINGATSDNNTKQLKVGYNRVLNDKIVDGSINLVAEEWAPLWMKEYAFSETDKFLQSKTKIDAIIAGNDGLADGIIEALSQHRLAGETLVVGQDADLAACQRIVEGTQLMTVYKPIEKLADATARMAIQMAKGEELTNIKNTINDGRYDVPYYVLEPIPVFKENLDETILKDGFHMYDEVYRNKP
ncbi:sugar ABC transporter substrate-binding protein [Alkaliphilus serpentinus]|uniref:Sugar ABC transporter substrate-binding protein n=1 Tax=Alkaliphilus serpentinus TaxID=1482731 RepID=A0A833M7Q3_9FIRM|nr:substrate-binding domain-containing protein [Alkaliphilus serpentinus]KAB3531118.1 sugar ABC transporter substrate-binding protein [Alkaliphilus serpentinus]